MSDTYRKILADAASQVTGKAKAVVDAVKPHVTLDNAVKVATVLNLAINSAVAVRSLPVRPPSPPPEPKP